MKIPLVLLVCICAMCFLNGCGGTSTPLLVTVSLSPGSAMALDVNQSVPITAIVNNAPNNQGFDWTLACSGGNCGTITAHTASGAPATFTAPSAAPSTAVTITAKLTGLTNSNGLTVTISLPPTVATTGAINAATLDSPYGLQLAANGGAGTLTWALGSGTSLPDTLILSNTGMITGTPSGTTGTFNFKVHVTDSGTPQLTSPDVLLSITVGAPAISIGLSPTSAYVTLKASKQFVATATNDLQSGNIDWTLTLNGVACTIAECGSVSPITTASGSPTTYTAPVTVPPANIILSATTVDGAPPASAFATVMVTAHGFVPTGSMTTEREYHSATLLDHGPALTNGKVLVTGGLGNNKQALAAVELFDPVSGTFAPAKVSMTTERAYHTATLLNDGTVLVTGGVDGSGAFLLSAELFDPTSGAFTRTKGSMDTPRAYHTATLLKDGTVLIAGGLDGTTGLVTAEVYNPATERFTPTTGSMQSLHFYHTATLLDFGPPLTNGKVLVAGGGTDTTATAELFDPSSGSFTATGGMEFDRRAHTANLLNDGRVLVAGGGGPTSDPNYGSSATAELFNPASGQFTPTTVDMATKRANHRAVLLNDGTVLVVGGVTVYACLRRNTCTTYLAASELFDPAANGSFTPTSDMTTPRAYHTATILKDGTVLVTGGDNGSGPLATAELYQ